MDERKYICYLLMIFMWACQFVRCVIFVAPVRVDVERNNSKEILSTSKEFKNYCDGNFSRPRVSKCCDLGFGYSSENKSCVQTLHEFLPDFEDCDNHSKKAKQMPLRKRYEYFIEPCLEDSYTLDPDNYPEDKYAVYSSGILLLQNHSYQVDGYCLETVDGVLKAFVCFGSEEVEFTAMVTFTLYATGLLISIPFLVITALLYLCIDQLRDLKGKSLACHCYCLTFAYLFLALVQLSSDNLNEETCEAFGFLMQYFFVAAFAWLNVICFDMWNCIRKNVECKAVEIDLKSQKLTFICYCIYGFFFSTLLSIVSLVMSYIAEIPENYVKPKFGFRSCWFHSSVAALSYFYGPIGILLLINVIFFFLSVYKILSEKQFCHKTRNKIHIFRICLNSLKECFYLFLLMGLNFVADVISWALGTFDLFWLIIDFFNLVQGVTIFIMFVLKPVTVRKIIKQKIRVLYFKIVKCNWSYMERSNNLVPPHWHADTEQNYTSNNTENETFL